MTGRALASPVADARTLPFDLLPQVAVPETGSYSPCCLKFNHSAEAPSGHPMILTSMRAIVLMLALFLAVAPVASAKRAPTAAEQIAIGRVVLADVQVPASYRSCLRASVRVSTADPAWAWGETLFVGRCRAVASNGYVLVHRTPARGWRVAWRGSDLPRCSSTTVPRAVSRDLVGCRA